jgi:TRAP-type mannitol/chloroaromatic compound transport system permease large subunit
MEIFKGVAPFVIISIVFVGILTAFPELALYLVEKSMR